MPEKIIGGINNLGKRAIRNIFSFSVKLRNSE
jgi:hypothetical protein